MWSSGDAVLLRYVSSGRVSWAKPVTVVEDSPGLVALYLAAGTPIKCRVASSGEPIPRSLSFAERWHLPWTTGDAVWERLSVLELVRPGEARSTWVAWHGQTGKFVGWYVNLQEPLRRTQLGFDTSDHVLDVDIDPDLSWRWKDEHELTDAVRVGRFTPEQASEIRAEGERAIAALEAHGWPFCDGWERWRPDPAWPSPALPDGWDRLS